MEFYMKNLVLITLTFIVIINPTYSTTRHTTLKSDQVQVDKWNKFVNSLYELHLSKTKQIDITTTESSGGYGGGFANKNFYREISYFNKDTKKLISTIQWEVDKPDTIHSIEVFLYNERGQVKTDYYARYLPYARNAPIQTLINLHNYNDQLHSFRQFDANGEAIYETCRGKFFNKEINFHLDNEEITDFKTNNTDEWLEEVYSACFMNTAKTASAYLNPSDLIKTKNNDSGLPLEHTLELLNQKIIKNPQDESLYVKRGQLFFQLHQFENAIKDQTKAISINNTLHQAYFERGMALARNGQIEDGIKDLTHFIKYNPDSSLAYTKRGVRYIWSGNLKAAQNDLLQAVKLDNTNSEAHDDLGVIYAQNKQFKKAVKHFSLAIQYDPSYQKAYHNLAMAYVITNKPLKALTAVDKSLILDSDSRNSLLLKGEILVALGKEKEANAIIRKAEFLPEGNWSERFSLPNK